MWDSEKDDRSMIGEDLIVSGNITCKSDLTVEGRVEGEIACTSLLVGKTGRITGDISAEIVRIEGTVTGMIKSDSVELQDGCTLEGDIASGSLSIDHGAVFTGSVKPGKRAGKSSLSQAAE